MVRSASESAMSKQPQSPPSQGGRQQYLDRASMAVTGCCGAGFLAIAAAMAWFGQVESVGPAIGGNVAVTLFAAMLVLCSDRQLSLPSLIALAFVGIGGLALALTSAAATAAGPQALLSGFRSAGIVAVIAMSFPESGRTGNVLVGTLTIVAALAGLGSVLGAVASTPDQDWTLARELTFSAWLLATSLGLSLRARPERAANVGDDRDAQPPEVRLFRQACRNRVLGRWGRQAS